MLKTAKIFTSILYLVIIIPGPKISVPIGMAMFLLPVLGISPGRDVATMLLLDLAFSYLLISAFKKNINRKLDIIYTLFSITCFIVFLLASVPDFIKYGTLYSLIPIGAWFIAACVCIYALLKSVKQRSYLPVEFIKCPGLLTLMALFSLTYSL